MASNKALDNQVGGSHYKNMAIQPMEFCEANKMGYCESFAIKYISRHRTKNGKQDLEKAIHCLKLLIELEYVEDDKEDGGEMFQVGDTYLPREGSIVCKDCTPGIKGIPDKLAIGDGFRCPTCGSMYELHDTSGNIIVRHLEWVLVKRGKHPSEMTEKELFGQYFLLNDIDMPSRTGCEYCAMGIGSRHYPVTYGDRFVCQMCHSVYVLSEDPNEELRPQWLHRGADLNNSLGGK